MANGIRTGDPRGFNKGRSTKFREGSRVRQTPEEGRRTYRPKRCGNNNKDEDNSPKTLNDKKHKNKETQLGRKTPVWVLQATNRQDNTREDLVKKKRNLKEETECLLIVA